MRTHNNLLFLGLALLLTGSSLFGQAKAAAKSGTTKAAANSSAPPATMAQLMKGILFTNSNVIFAAQDTDPAKVVPAKDQLLRTAKGVEE